MENLQNIGINTHFIKVLNMKEQLVKRADTIPLEVVVRNIAAGSLCNRLNIEEGRILSNPIIETYYKNDKLGDPLVTDDHILTLDWLKSFELEEIKIMAWRINDFLSGSLSSAGITLVDLKLEFGFYDDQIILIDEISPDTCRFWDIKTKEKMDKDRFRQDMGGVAKYYKEVATRLGVLKDIKIN
jgi:phosphoribosylaminoimidazole-succinocarboxamide synthase